MTGPAIVWFRDDLRLGDHPALRAAIDRRAPLVLLYLLDDESDEVRPNGAAARWWVHHSLTSLGADIAARGGELVLRRGPAEEEVPRLVRETGADAVYWNRRYTKGREIDARLMESLRADGVEVSSFAANLLFEPWTVQTGQGEPFKVFTPFWREASQHDVRDPLPAPRSLETVSAASDDLASWELLPTAPDWTEGLRDTWTVGERGAHRALENFVAHTLEDYHDRDHMALDATSHLSPRLARGELSPFQVWHRLHAEMTPDARKDAPKFLREIGWREFNWQILFHNPDLATVNYRRDFDAFEWEEHPESELDAWRQGRTGVPLVDAGMRELWRTGYMHNRVRLVTASFLIKNLRADWRIGERWFWDCLVDADEANNPGNWQWVAGSGADAAPYFRVFNPLLQADKFDKRREYVRRWVPEVDEPEYPEPMVDLSESRRRALDAYQRMQEKVGRR
jgi:deoxyribodipyrimidine photo-lyase